MMNENDFEEAVFFKKRECQKNGWNALDLRASDLLKESGSDNAEACALGMLRNMMTGDQILEGNANTRDNSLVIRYYCDNLDESRGRVFSE